MKTPRDILFEKHQDAQPQLDAIRSAVLQREFSSETKTASSASPSFLYQLWTQLILPSRRIWVGIAAAWVVVFVLHFAAPGDDGIAYVAAPPRDLTPEQQMALKQQQQLFVELVSGSAPVPAEKPRYVPRPSSAVVPVVRCV